MTGFKKVYNLKVLALVVAVVMIFNSTGYGVDFCQKNYLRKPMVFCDGSNDDGKHRYFSGLCSGLLRKGKIVLLTYA